jgi:hypothetical protein
MRNAKCEKTERLPIIEDSPFEDSVRKQTSIRPTGCTLQIRIQFDMLSREPAMSRSAFFAKFKAHFNVSPIEYRRSNASKK